MLRLESTLKIHFYININMDINIHTYIIAAMQRCKMKANIPKIKIQQITSSNSGSPIKHFCDINIYIHFMSICIYFATLRMF